MLERRRHTVTTSPSGRLHYFFCAYYIKCYYCYANTFVTVFFLTMPRTHTHNSSSSDTLHQFHVQQLSLELYVVESKLHCRLRRRQGSTTDIPDTPGVALPIPGRRHCTALATRVISLSAPSASRTSTTTPQEPSCTNASTFRWIFHAVLYVASPFVFRTLNMSTYYVSPD